MALKSLAGLNGPFPHMGKNQILEWSSGSVGVGVGVSPLNWRRNGRPHCGAEEERSAPPLLPQSQQTSSVEAKREPGGGGDGPGLRRRNRDFGSLPKPLSVTDFSASNHGSKVCIAYQGSAGAFSEAAAFKAYPQCETLPCDEFEAAFKAVELWVVDKAVLPIENTLSGSFQRNYDLLLRHRLHIVGEVQLAVNYCLMALPGVRKENLLRVFCHQQALAECEIALSKLSVIRENVEDSAAAAQYIATKGLRDAGAISSERAAAIYGLNILEEKMQDYPICITRFLILAREPIMPRTDRPFKTSIVFTLNEGPGVLFKALALFAFRDINLIKIESRPQRNRPLRVVDDSNKGTAKYFDYLFYVDFEASMAEPRAQSALALLQEYATFLRILGSFPMDTFTEAPS
ncbi:arogenate dehydratase/prephenate dehydratase 1, chloroplastic-like [Iris pallida]|uniref:arogenate dehydratase n=1 Tax=Iris pallida TaxID=29817 RepID=A0AAX6IJA8_IRIPA|nr:arogenate dehydratase/prephenate dehydratase 1, chloroplastic-like [Iris pallida]